MVIEIILTIYLIIIATKLLCAFYYISKSKKHLSEKVEYKGENNVKMIILIPVLREQRIIEHTLDHFKSLKLDNIELCVCVAGTSREAATISSDITTGVVVTNWINENSSHFPSGLSVCYSEINETEGDRASQLNYGVKKALCYFEPDLIGVYDADSLPNEQTLLEVAEVYRKDPKIVMQQPVHFISAANRMAAQRKNPILVANALYQTDWTIIRELPRWHCHYNFSRKHSDKIYPRNDYLIGHGEFIPYEIYKTFLFPENEVTDGIQLGYRISMAGIPICPLHTFCVDDVPQTITQLIHQHKRWFGGCNRVNNAYSWCKKNIHRTSLSQMIDGYWSQLSWAYAAISAIIALVLSIIRCISGNYIYLLLTILFLLTYCYIIPVISHKAINVKTKIRFIDWLCLPIATLIKGIGPNLYLVETAVCKLLNKKIKYTKVER